MGVDKAKLLCTDLLAVLLVVLLVVVVYPICSNMIIIRCSLGKAVVACYVTLSVPLVALSQSAILLTARLSPSSPPLVSFSTYVTVMSQNAESLHLLFPQSGSHGAQT